MQVPVLRLLLVSTLLLAAPLAQAEGLGEQLEQGFWKAMKSHDMASIANQIAPGFLSIHDDGPRTRDQEIALIDGLKLGDYTLSRFKERRQGATIVVTYFVSVAETIAGQRLDTAPAARQSVWLMTENGWQWIAHANLHPVQEGR